MVFGQSGAGCLAGPGELPLLAGAVGSSPALDKLGPAGPALRKERQEDHELKVDQSQIGDAVSMRPSRFLPQDLHG